jgi:hypothetical protein
MTDKKKREEKPPFLGEWKYVYAMIIGSLVAMILLLYFFTKYFE